MAAEVDAEKPYRKSTRLLLSQYFENLQSKRARDGWERSAMAYGVLHSGPNISAVRVLTRKPDHRLAKASNVTIIWLSPG